MSYYNGLRDSGFLPIGPNGETYLRLDISGDAGHATPDEFDKFECAKMITQAYVYKKTKKFLWTFSSYDEKEEVFSDRNIFPIGCILSMEKITQ